MKNFIRYFLMLVCLIMCCASFFGCLSTITYENSHKYSIGDVVLTGTVEALDIEWLSGSITVEYGGDNISVSETSNKELSEKTMLRYWLDGTTLKIRFAQTGRLNAAGLEKDLKITLPSTVMLKNADIYGAAVDINLNGITAEYCEAETVSGDINFKDTIISISADVSTIGGNISIVNQGIIKDISAENVSGNIELTASVENEIEAETISGNMNITMLTSTAEGELSSVSGNVQLNMPEEAGFTAEYETVSGNVSCKFEATTENNAFKIAGGGKVFKIETVSGNINIEKLR